MHQQLLFQRSPLLPAGQPATHQAVTPLLRRSAVTCHAQSSPTAAAAPSTQPLRDNSLLIQTVEALFKFPPFFNMAAASARRKIMARGDALGLDVSGRVAALQRAADWDAQLAAVARPGLAPPAYYTQPFHAYPDGNLCWQAALEVEAAAQSVHAPVMDPANKEMRPDGDQALRRAYSDRLRDLMAAAGARRVRDALDLGCATGLSSAELARAFPGAAVTGLDLSPHFLAVATFLQAERHQGQGPPAPITFLHANAEATGLPDASFDLVSMCLVLHELPAAASCAVFAEAHRLLRPGGSLAIMEMNPASPAWQRIFANPFAYTAFKSTEPWLTEYCALDLPAALAAAGFGRVAQADNSPRHRTVVAVKPQ